MASTKKEYPYGYVMANPQQRRNPILQHTTSRIKYSSIKPDYTFSTKSCAYFLSLQYHLLHPEYIYKKIEDSRGDGFSTRVLLCYIDVSEYQTALIDVQHIALANNLAVVCAKAIDELGRWLDILRTNVGKSLETSIIVQEDENELLEIVASIPNVNHTDASTLLGAFKTMRGIANASSDSMLTLPGLGRKKIAMLQRLVDDDFSSDMIG